MRCLKTVFHLIVFTLLTSEAASAFAQASQPSRPFIINHHERIPDLMPSAPDSARTPAPTAPQESRQLSITAFGKTFALELETNERLIADLPMAQRRRLAQKIKLFRGQLAGIKGSWVRLSQSGARYAGMRSDGTEIYIIDQSDEMANALTAPESRSYPIMYRLKDATWPDAQCALDPTAKPINDYGALVQELNDAAQALPAATKNYL